VFGKPIVRDVSYHLSLPAVNGLCFGGGGEGENYNFFFWISWQIVLWVCLKISEEHITTVFWLHLKNHATRFPKRRSKATKLFDV
jgi:hypothetical protein